MEVVEKAGLTMVVLAVLLSLDAVVSIDSVLVPLELVTVSVTVTVAGDPCAPEDAIVIRPV